MPPRPRPPHLRFINPLSEPEGNGAFPQFTKLPLELRLEIWKLTVCYERLIRLRLVARKPGNLFDKSGQETQQPEEFVAVVEERQDISKLFRTCHESREAAMQFYRVQVPCNYHRDGTPLLQGTFYFNPELDILSFPGIVDHDIDQAKYLPRFAQMLWDNDPQHVGLINLAMTTERWYRGCKHFFEPDNQQLVREFLSRLRCVIFGFHGSCTGRIWPESEPWRMFEKGHIDRSRPLLASVSKFQRLTEDPRAVLPELKRIRMPYGDPRDQMFRWLKLLERRQIQYDYPVQYKFMLTFDTPKVMNRHHAYLELKKEHEEWEAWQVNSTQNEYWVACEDNLEEAIPSAYGFWLFPIEAFGPLPCLNERVRMTGFARKRDLINYPDVWQHAKTWDLSESKPELCLQHLPKAEGRLERKWKLSRRPTRMNLTVFFP